MTFVKYWTNVIFFDNALLSIQLRITAIIMHCFLVCLRKYIVFSTNKRAYIKYCLH